MSGPDGPGVERLAQRVDRLQRVGAPLILLGLAGLVWFERWLPGRAWIAEQFGDDAVLRFALGCVCVYAAVLVVERQQMGALFQQVLGQFRRFHESQGRLRSAGDGAARAEAIRILVAALRSDEAEVRRSARENLTRLLGHDHGEDPAAWQRALERETGPD